MLFSWGKRMILQTTPRFPEFFEMRSLTGDEWIMDDALCAHMEKIVFLAEKAGFLIGIQTPRIIGFPDKRSVTGSLNWAGWHVMSQ